MSTHLRGEQVSDFNVHHLSQKIEPRRYRQIRDLRQIWNQCVYCTNRSLLRMWVVLVRKEGQEDPQSLKALPFRAFTSLFEIMLHV